MADQSVNQKKCSEQREVRQFCSFFASRLLSKLSTEMIESHTQRMNVGVSHIICRTLYSEGPW